jgi:hypothetical protein
MRVPDELRKCVVFIGISEGPEIKFKGTAFLVHVPINPTHLFGCLVTAKHVAKKLEGREFVVRLNTADGKSAILSGPSDAKWWYHDKDESVDVAVSPYYPPPNIDCRILGIDVFATEENLAKLGIGPGIGDEVYISGLFVRHSGTDKNIPIIRVGNISMMPDEERVKTKDFGPMEAYLIEARSTGGLSGSPVFLHSLKYDHGKVREGSSGIMSYFSLLGLVHGHWNLPHDDPSDAVVIDDDGPGKINTGIAVVVPSRKIIEVLNHPELIAMRNRFADEVAKRDSPTPD